MTTMAEAVASLEAQGKAGKTYVIICTEDEAANLNADGLLPYQLSAQGNGLTLIALLQAAMEQMAGDIRRTASAPTDQAAH